jgi:adenylate kinase family enzyme
VISHVIVHIDGPPGAGKTTFVERLLGALDEWVLAVRCRRDESLRQARESSSARDPEVRRYRVAGRPTPGGSPSRPPRTPQTTSSLAGC